MTNFVSPNQIQIQIGLVLLVRPDTCDNTSQPCHKERMAEEASFRRCAACGESAAPKRCSACYLKWYCGKECQAGAIVLPHYTFEWLLIVGDSSDLRPGLG